EPGQQPRPDTAYLLRGNKSSDNSARRLDLPIRVHEEGVHVSGKCERPAVAHLHGERLSLEGARARERQGSAPESESFHGCFSQTELRTEETATTNDAALRSEPAITRRREK